MILNELAAAEQIGFPILTTLILLPIAVAVLILFVPDDTLARRAALTGAVIELGLALFMVVGFVPGVPDIQFAERVSWIATLGVGYHVGVDGISVLFVPLTAFVTVVVILAGWRAVRFRPKAYLVALLALEATMVGVFVALDLVLFFLFWELMLVPIYFVIKLWGIGPGRHIAALKYVMYMLLGSAPLLIGIVVLGVGYRDTGGAGALSFDLPTLLTAEVPRRLQTLVFALLAFGFAVKAPVFPFHTWLPTVLMEGPIGMGVYLAGIKLGVYGFLRFAVPLVPEAARRWFWVMAVLAVIAVVYGGLIALAQPNLRRLLAFATVSHVGLAMLGVFSLNTQGIQGAVVLMIHLGLSVGGLLLAAGFLHGRTGSTELSAFGGLARHVPFLATFFFLVTLAGIGVPGTSGFPGEFLILLGTFRLNPALGAVAVLGVILGAAYLLPYFGRAFLGPVTGRAAHALTDLLPREKLIASALGITIFFIGLFPGPLLAATSGSAKALAERVRGASAAAALEDGEEAVSR